MSSNARPIASITIRDTCGDFFRYYPKYSASIDYLIEPDDRIAIVSAEIHPSGGNVPIHVAPSLYQSLANCYAEHLREHYATVLKSQTTGPRPMPPDNTLNLALAWIIKAEGGYNNDANDLGGETKYGISKRQYPELDIAGLTIEAAQDIYRRDYWHAHQLDALPPPAALWVFDSLVNHTPGSAIKILQRSVGARPDGLLGPRTIARTQGAEQRPLIHEMAERRLDLYQTIFNYTPTSAKFLRGWRLRIIHLLDHTLTHFFNNEA